MLLLKPHGGYQALLVAVYCRSIDL